MTTALCKNLIGSLFLLSLFSCNLITVNQHSWEEQGPFAIINGQCEGIPDKPVIGAVSSILPDPDDANDLIIGSVNGGIWITENALSATPDWQPADDSLPSMSISCMTRDLFNPNIIWAGVGFRSSYRQLSGPLVGILKSTDRGETWINNSVGLNALNILDIAVGLYNENNDDNRSIYVATSSGLFKATDGNTFNQVTAIPSRWVSDLFCDEKGTLVIVAVPQDSVYVSSNSGASFRGLNINFSNALDIKLSVASNRLYIAESRLNTSNAFINIVDLNNLTDVRAFAGPITREGLLLTQKGPFTETNSLPQLHFSFIAHTYDNNEIELFLGGISNQDLILSSTGQGTYSGRIFHGIHNLDFNTLGWSPAVGNGANGTATHADSRFLVFDKDENLLEADDGGIYKLTSPFLLSPQRRWSSLNGDLRISEVTSVAYDHHNNAIIAGLQDNGSIEQKVSVFSDEEKVWTCARQFTFFNIDFLNAVGDGYSVNVDNQHDPPIRYIMQNNLGAMFKRTYSEIQPPFVGAPWDYFFFNNGCIAPLHCFLNASDRADIASGAGLVPFELNATDHSKFVLGGRGIYKLTDTGDDIRLIDTGTIRTTSIAYGSRDMPEVVYYAKSGRIHQQVNTGSIWVRREFQNVLDIAIDLNNGNNLFFVSTGGVFKINGFFPTGDAEDLTFNLNTLIGTPQSTAVISVVEVTIPDSPAQQFVLIGDWGGVYILLHYRNTPKWAKLGFHMPNVLISEIRYDAEDDILVVGTIGRGVWVMKDFSEKVPRLQSGNFSGPGG